MKRRTEKKQPHYNLEEAKAFFSTPEQLVNNSSKYNAIYKIQDMGMKLTEAVELIQELGSKHFSKSMLERQTGNKLWLDVYKTEWNGGPVYLKFKKTENGFFFMASFK